MSEPYNNEFTTPVLQDGQMERRNGSEKTPDWFWPLAGKVTKTVTS
jgi:hypothetical protein